jgi:hypothetical protein
MATTWSDLFLAILSPDVYNRGYNRGMTIAAPVGRQPHRQRLGRRRQLRHGAKLRRRRHQRGAGWHLDRQCARAAPRARCGRPHQGGRGHRGRGDRVRRLGRVHVEAEARRRKYPQERMRKGAAKSLNDNKLSQAARISRTAHSCRHSITICKSRATLPSMFTV